MRLSITPSQPASLKILIVNADDFGLSPGVNRGVMVAYRDGLVTSASLITNLPAFADAVNVASRCPTLGVGVHLTLSCGSPLSGLAAWLRRADGRFAPWPRLLMAAALPPGRGALTGELRTQVERALASGIRVTHLDMHHNLHLFPLLRRCVEDVAGRFGIHWVRFRDQVPFGIQPCGEGTALLRNRAKLALTRWLCGARSADRRRIFGAPQMETSSAERTLEAAISAVGEGITEIACHPGYLDEEAKALDPKNRERENELAALTSPALKQRVAAAGIRLASYGDLDAVR